MKIKVEPLLPTGNYLNVRIGIEKDFPDNANEMDSVFEVWDNIIAMHMKRYPHLYKDGQPLYEGYKGEEQAPVEVQIKKQENPVDNMIQAITSCTEVATLKTFEKLAKSKPEFQTAYDNRLKELQP
jgi:hypothetical protein